MYPITHSCWCRFGLEPVRRVPCSAPPSAGHDDRIVGSAMPTDMSATPVSAACDVPDKDLVGAKHVPARYQPRSASVRCCQAGRSASCAGKLSAPVSVVGRQQRGLPQLRQPGVKPKQTRAPDRSQVGRQRRLPARLAQGSHQTGCTPLLTAKHRQRESPAGLVRRHAPKGLRRANRKATPCGSCRRSTCG